MIFINTTKKSIFRHRNEESFDKFGFVNLLLFQLVAYPFVLTPRSLRVKSGRNLKIHKIRQTMKLCDE